jgi:L-lactate dehydrogenase complex protein LldG
LSVPGESAQDTSRGLILSRIRDALATAGSAAPQGGGAGRDSAGAGGSPPRAYRTSGSLSGAECIDLFCERIGDYNAAVHRTSAADLAATISAAFAAEGAVRICVPTAIPAHWLGEETEYVADVELGFVELDQLDGVLTGATVAIAETGTIVLSCGPTEGRRALSLIPDLHVCVVGEEQVVETVPEAIRPLADLVRAERRPLTFISGPSATSDIELSRVEGVHGPRRLIVIVVEKEEVP